jgi:hypothetical protein
MEIVIICVYFLDKTFGLIVNKILIEKFENARIPVTSDKCRKKKTLSEVKIEHFNDYFRKTSKKYGDDSNVKNTNYSIHDEIVMDFRTMFTKI